MAAARLVRRPGDWRAGRAGDLIRAQAGSPRRALLTAIALAVAVAITLGGGLLAIRHDLRYSGDFQPTRDLLALLKQRGVPTT